MRIQPTIVEHNKNGPYGMLHSDDDPGFTAREYGSIPPVASEDAIIEDLDPTLEKALERLIIDPQDFRWLDEGVKASILILKYGYISMLNPNENCRQEALSHRSPRVQYLWGRLNWDEIMILSFRPLSPENQQEVLEFYDEIGRACPVSAMYRTPYARWINMGTDCDGYVAAQWVVRM